MPYTLQTPQTLQEFLAKYAGALDSQGRFIPGKANLEYDGMKAEDVYSLMIGGSPLYDADGNSMGTQPMAAEVNADWIEDPRAKGWIAQHPAGAAIIGTVLGGVGANMAGLLGTGATAGGASTAFGGGGLGAANAVTAADLALTSMPQAVTGAGFAGGGTVAGLGAAGSAVGAGAFGGGGLGTANAVSASDLALTPMPQAVTGTGTFASGGTIAGGKTMLDSAGQFLKDNPTLTKLGGAVLGALAGGDTTTSSQKDPWGPAQPYLLQNLKRNAEMQDYYAKNPFSTEQKSAYQGLLDTLANNQANAPAMSGMANSFMGSNRGLLANMPQFTSGVKAPVVDWSKYSNIGLMG